MNENSVGRKERGKEGKKKGRKEVKFKEGSKI